MHQVSRQKINALMEVQMLLENRLSAKSSNIVDRVLENVRIQYHEHGSFGVESTHEMFELTMLSSLSDRSGRWIGERTRQWALACETSGGFGVWPGSGPRLSSTYQCLRILQQTGGIPKLDGSRHIAWIQSLQSSDGSFRGPWSHRPQWEDTHYAVAALSMLGSLLENGARDGGLEWVRRTLIHEGIEKGQLDAFHYCLAAADTLQHLDEKIVKTAGSWLLIELDKLLLTNVGHNAENIRHAVCAYWILKEQGFSTLAAERIDLLADRVGDAVDAELAVLRPLKTRPLTPD